LSDGAGRGGRDSDCACKVVATGGAFICVGDPCSRSIRIGDVTVALGSAAGHGGALGIGTFAGGADDTASCKGAHGNIPGSIGLCHIDA
jgi:hypothetical protein